MLQNGNFHIPYLCAGEIRKVMDFDEKYATVRYEILVRFQDGSETYLYNVPSMSGFGGVSDFVHTRLRASKDDQSGNPENKFTQEGRLQSIGDRVVVAFLSGDFKQPIIVGAYPHPNRKFDIPDPETDDTQLKASYLGMEVEVNPVGETKITHRGAPAISFDGSIEPEKIEQTGPAEIPDRASEEFVPFEAHAPTISEKAQKLIDEGIPVTEYPESSGAVYPDEQYKTQMGFLEKGEWYVSDSEGQQVYMDRDAQTITLTNGNEIIQIDKANKIIFMQCTGSFEIRAEGDEVKNIVGNKHLHVETDEVKKVGGNVFNTTEGNISKQITGNYEEKISGNWTVKSEGEFFKVQMKSGNTLYMDDKAGKEAMFLIHKSGAQISISSKGNIMLLGADGSNVSISGEKGNVILQPSKGGLVSVNDKILLADASGKQMITVSDANIEINASKEVVLSCKAVSLNSGSVSLGAQATMSAVVWENLQIWLDSHIHASPVGPTSPAIIPTTTFKMTPLDPGSKYVKIRANL